MRDTAVQEADSAALADVHTLMRHEVSTLVVSMVEVLGGDCELGTWWLLTDASTGCHEAIVGVRRFKGLNPGMRVIGDIRLKSTFAGDRPWLMLTYIALDRPDQRWHLGTRVRDIEDAYHRAYEVEREIAAIRTRGTVAPGR